MPSGWDEQSELREENTLSKRIIGAAIGVHRTLGGPGLLEKVYEEALVTELRLQGLQCTQQQEVPIIYKGHQLQTPLRLDLLVEGRIIVEAKAVETFNTIYKVQTLTYLRLTKLRLGMVINFGARYVSKGIYRVVN